MKTPVTALFAMFVVGVFGNPDQPTTPAAGGPVRTFHVSGHYNPELVPQQMLWESFFRNIATAAEDEPEIPREKRIAGLSKYSLKIPTKDVLTVIQVATRVVKSIDHLRERLHSTDSASRLMTVAERRILLTSSSEEAMKGRDELVRLLSPTSFDAVRLYVTEEYVKGIEVELPIDRQ